MKIYSLPYARDLVHHYASFRDLEGFVLLESKDKSHGRYDILTARPYDRLQIFRDNLGHLEQLKKRLVPTSSASDLPFQGGAIGYFSYDFGAQLMGIDSTPHPLWANLPVVDLGFFDWAILVDHALQKVHALFINEQYKNEIYERWYSGQNQASSFSLGSDFKPLLDQSEYEKAYHAIRHALVQGRVYQVNLTQPFTASYQGDPWIFYQQIRSKNPVPYASFLKLQDTDILSFSPERFLTIDKGQVLTSPIKGTAKRSLKPEEDVRLRDSLAACAKNKAENVMIVDLMRNDLGQFATPGSVKVSMLCEVQSYHKVHHLVSHIQANCNHNVLPIDAFLSCFPGGSITGAPKLEAMRMIAEEERYSRGIYCGSIAYFSNHGRVDSSIAIRTMTARKGELYLPAGGAIVMDSVYEEEYQECFTKISAFNGHSRA